MFFCLSNAGAASKLVTIVNESKLEIIVFANGGGPVNGGAPIGQKTTTQLRRTDKSQTVRWSLFSAASSKLIMEVTTTTNHPTVTVTRAAARSLERRDLFTLMIRDWRLKRMARRNAAATIIQACVTPVVRAELVEKHAKAARIQRVLRPPAHRLIRRRIRAATLIQACALAMSARARDECSICLEMMPRPLFTGVKKPAIVPAARPSPSWRRRTATPSGRSTAATPCHRACGGCVRAYLARQIDDGRLHIRCFASGCSTLVAKDDLTHHVPRPYEAYTARMADANRARLRSLACSTDDADRSFLIWASENTRICPSCNVVVFRYAGCHSITCRCGGRFNWNAAARPESGMAIEAPSGVSSAAASIAGTATAFGAPGALLRRWNASSAVMAMAETATATLGAPGTPVIVVTVAEAVAPNTSNYVADNAELSDMVMQTTHCSDTNAASSTSILAPTCLDATTTEYATVCVVGIANPDDAAGTDLHSVAANNNTATSDINGNAHANPTLITTTEVAPPTAAPSWYRWW